MARESGDDRASDDAINRLVDALDERNDHLEGLITTAKDVEESVEALRRDVFARPTRQEISHRRRVTVALLVLFGYLLLGVSDLNVNQCSPGHKAGFIVDQIAKGKVLTPAQFQTLTNRRLSPLCDVAFPLHKHDGRDQWPTPNNLLGFLLILTACGAIAAYARGPRGWEPRKEPVEEP